MRGLIKILDNKTLVIIIIFILFLSYYYIKNFIMNCHNRKKKNIRFIILCIILLSVGIIIYVNKSKENGDFIKKDENKVIINEESEKTTTLNSETTSETTTTTTTSSSTTTKPKATTTKAKETIKNSKVEYKDGAYYIEGHLIVNKTYSLSSNFIPKNTHKKITNDMGGICKECIDNEAYEAWTLMKNDAAALNLNIWIQSGYRSYEYQKDLYDSHVKNKGKTGADKVSARAGHSEHQSGLAFDLNSVSSAFKNTDEGKWVNNNCYLYGFIIRYPENSSDKTGYSYEPWHLRYVGKDLAGKLYNNGNWITMEEYFNLTSVYEG